MISNLKVVKDKTILITGGTGSFGQWIVKELLLHDPLEIRVFSRDEEKQLDMQRQLSSSKIKYIIGDIRDYDRVLEATRDVHLLYHAAALKIVPTCEKNTMEALKTNTLGTWNVRKAAIENGVEKSILISTDKAVKPVNLYGMTKAMAEKIWVSNEYSNRTKFALVRYGNVIGSRGSVIPYFKQLIQEHKTLPITHRDMTRFLITLPQAVELVLYASDTAEGGEIFVPKIPACKMVDLARVMAGENYPLVFIGIRPGEKIHECLIQEDEFRRAIEKEKCYVLLPYGKYDSGKLNEEYNSQNAYQLNDTEIEELLLKTQFLQERSKQS
jgi:UDP-N-acetylglucosamine 4,6-dehydratase